MTEREMLAAVDRAERGAPLSVEEMTCLLSTPQERVVEYLLIAADRVRRLAVGDDVHLRGLIEFSNYCRRNCLYCGIRCAGGPGRYRMSPEDILAVAAEIRGCGLGTVVLQSGEDPWYDADRLCWVIERIKEGLGLAVTLSVGERDFADYDKFRRAGADRYLLRHETSDPALYSRLHPGQTLDERLAHLARLHELGFQAGSGNMVGLPGQTMESLAADIALIRDMKLQMAGVGPFIPAPGTPLEGTPPGSLDTVLRELALLRLSSPYLLMPSTTAVAVLDPGGRRQALNCGANVMMPNFTPAGLRERYSIYPGKGAVAAHGGPAVVRKMQRMIRSMGRTVGRGPGHSQMPESSAEVQKHIGL